jgi:glutamine amidotransferase
MERLRTGGWIEALQRQVVEDGKPLLGICLGMQMLADGSEEGEPTAGLGFIPGRIRFLKNLGCTLRIPHVGWNDVAHRSECPLFDEIPQGMDFYFVHSYAFDADDPTSVAATTSYGVEVTAAVWRRHVLGTQFHPEKSSKAGWRLLKNFLDFVPC